MREVKESIPSFSLSLSQIENAMAAFYDLCVVIGEGGRGNFVGDTHPHSDYTPLGSQVLHPRFRQYVYPFYHQPPLARAWWIHSINYTRYKQTEERRAKVWQSARNKAIEKVHLIQKLTAYLKTLRLQQEPFGVYDDALIYRALNFLIRFKENESKSDILSTSLFIPSTNDPGLSFSFINFVDPDLLVEAKLQSYMNSNVLKPDSPVHFDASDDFLETGSYCSRRSFYSADSGEEHTDNLDEDDVATSYTAESHEYTIEAPSIGENTEAEVEAYVLNKRQVADKLNALPMNEDEFKRSNEILRDMLGRLESRCGGEGHSRRKPPEEFGIESKSSEIGHAPWYMKCHNQSSFTMELEHGFSTPDQSESKWNTLESTSEYPDDYKRCESKKVGETEEVDRGKTSAQLIPSPLFPSQFVGTSSQKEERMVFDKHISRQEMEEMMKKERNDGIKRHKKKMLLIKAEKMMEKIEAVGPVVNIDALLAHNEPILTPQEEERRQMIRRAKDAITKIRYVFFCSFSHFPHISSLYC